MHTLAMLVLLTAARTSTAASAPSPSPDTAAVPEALRSWIPWVLRDHEDARCPFLLGKTERGCLWPSRLALQLEERGGRFSEDWAVYVERDGFAELPGDGKHWPLEVTVDGKPAPVLDRDGTPTVALTRGNHTVAGHFAWDSLPEALHLPSGVGLLDLTRSGKAVAFPDVDGSGNLNLQRETKAAPEENGLTVTVTRLLHDDMPFAITTNIELEVTGKSREELLGPALLPGTFAVSLVSALPVRLEADGRLRVQVRQGTWTLQLTAYANRALASLAMPAQLTGWPSEEVWAFSAETALREVQLSGLSEVDPERTHLPAEWKRFPAYRATPGTPLALDERRRGDPDPAPDHLELNRSLWLDFDGRGYTVQDEVSGQMHRGWRLSLSAPAALGHASVNGRDQLITRDANGLPGIEVRQGQLALKAESRLEGDHGVIPAVGWAHDMKRVVLWLNLPPGWQLFHAFGADTVGDDFITQWTLLDFFILLITGIAAGRLFGPNVGLLALIALGLTFHEEDAPQWLWLLLLAVQAGLRLLQGGKLQTALKVARVGCAGLLAIWFAVFSVQQLRHALYPALDRTSVQTHAGHGFGAFAKNAPAGAMFAPAPDAPMPEPQMVAPPPAPPEEVAAAPSKDQKADLDGDEKEESGKGGSHGWARQQATTKSLRSSISYADVVDNEAIVQTGPGLPTWQWSGIPLSFSGPVPEGHLLRLWLIPPALGRLLCVVRVALLAALLVLLLGLSFGGTLRLLRGKAALAALLFSALASGSARADIPSAEVLKTLGDRLAEPAKCSPACGSLQSLALTATATELKLSLVANAAADVALPLPANLGQWRPDKVTVDGQKAPLRREDDGFLWVAVTAGVHKIELTGALPRRDTVQLSLPLRPHYVTAQVSGWSLAGVHEDGAADADLQLSRTAPAERSASAEATGLRADALPPFARVERTLQLGLTWNVHTRVVRDSPTGAAVVLEVPLLPGESVVTGDLRVVAKKALVNLGPTDTELEFDGKLEANSPLVLTAPKDVPWSETWRLDASSIWHVESSGLAPIHEQSASGQRLPEWRPWPGEQITLTVTRPTAVPGQSVTVDSSDLDVTPGERQTDSDLKLNVRTSRGGQQKIALPEGAKIEALLVGGRSQPVPQSSRTVSVALLPGAQTVAVRFTQAEDLHAFYTMPRVDLGLPNVNATLHLHVPADRWILWVHGPDLGPAVLFWGTLFALALVAFGLARLRLTPLRPLDWFLLGIGFTQTPVVSAVIFTGFLLTLGLRRTQPLANRTAFNFGQVVLAVWAVVAVGTLVGAVQQGLLGAPEMQITGYGSYGNQLNWFADRSAGPLPTGFVFSLPLWVYRLAMLAWALWLALACLRWVAWAWGSYSTGGFWRPAPLPVPKQPAHKPPPIPAPAPAPAPAPTPAPPLPPKP